MSSRWILPATVAVAVAIGIAFSQWESRTLPVEFERSISSPAHGLTRIKFSADGLSLFAASGEGHVVHWAMPGNSGGEALSPAGGAPISVLGLSSDGLVLAGDLSGRLRLWELPALTPVETQSPAVPSTSVIFRSQSEQKQLFLGMAEGRIVTIDETGITPRASGHQSVKALLLNAQQTQLISGGAEGDLIWYDLEAEQLLDRQRVHTAEISALLLSPDGHSIISADWNGGVRVTTADSRKLIAAFSQPDAISAITMRGQKIVTGSWDGHIRIWAIDGETGRLISDINTGLPVLDMSLTPDSRSAATVSGNNRVEFWTLP
ncbi:MAG: WD40 repeat domain-containing protein [Planctomycetaceae bacterium]